MSNHKVLNEGDRRPAIDGIDGQGSNSSSNGYWLWWTGPCLSSQSYSQKIKYFSENLEIFVVVAPSKCHGFHFVHPCPLYPGVTPRERPGPGGAGSRTGPVMILTVWHSLLAMANFWQTNQGSHPQEKTLVFSELAVR